MDATHQKRTLRTILAADVVSYSRHMSEAENETITSLARHREVIDRLIIAENGLIFTTAGDSVVAEFDSPPAAVRCALSAQEAIHALHETAIVARPLKFRIGIHTGDVLRRGGTLIGDAVNVAARLESLAPSGGLLISQEVMDHLDPITAAAFQYRGLTPLKDISRPIATYDFGGRPIARMLRMRRACWRWRRSIAVVIVLLAFSYIFAAYDGVAFFKVGIGYRMAPAGMLFSEDPPTGWLTPGQRVLVDNGVCPLGQVKEVSGGNITLGLSRGERCVLRP